MADEGGESEEARLYRAEIERLGREAILLDRQWKTKYWLGLFALAAVPIYFVAGRFWAGIAIVMTPALVATQAYLLAVRRSEVRELLAEAKNALASLRRPLPTKSGTVG